MSAETAVQAALFTALTGAGLTVYDAAPQSPTWPYVEIGTIIMTTRDTLRERGFEFVARIHTRSASTSMKEMKNIQGEIYDALHLTNPAIAGFTTILLRRESSAPMRAPDGTFHGVCEYRGHIST